jgi:hypothetical protein
MNVMCLLFECSQVEFVCFFFPLGITIKFVNINLLNFFITAESVNRSQMDIKRKHMIFEHKRKKRYRFLDIPFSNSDTLVISL